MSNNWLQYDRLLQERENDSWVILTEAEKHYKQALANYETAKKERAAWTESIDSHLEEIEKVNSNSI